MKRKEIIFYIMHEMHSLLFAALETFSLILLRKKNSPKKKKVITFSDYLLCESASSAAHRVTVCLIFDQFYTVSDYTH